MKNMNTIGATALFAMASTLGQAADVVLGVPNWPSASATSHVLKVVLEENLGLEVAMQSGTNPIIWEAMDRSSMHLHPEVWLPNQGNLYQTYVVEKGTVVKNENSIEAKQGICITKEMSEKHGITSIYDLTDADKTAFMDTNNNGMGEIWVGQPGAASTSIEIIRAKDYGYDQTLELVETDTPINWASLDAAVQAGRPYVFSCYIPHYIFSLYEIVFLEEPPHNADTWNVLQPTDDPDWLAKSTADSGWPVANVQMHYAKSLEESQPEAALILKNFKVTAEILSDWSYAIVVDQQDPETVATQWVQENSAIVDGWLGL